MTAQSLAMPQATLERWKRNSATAAATGLGLTLVLGLMSPADGMRAWLYAFLFWSGVALGCLSLTLIHNLTGGMWGLAIRRLMEAGTRTFPALAVLFLPLVFSLRTLFVWADPEAVAADALLQHKAPYLNVPFFLIRAVIYFAVWIFLAHLVNSWSRQLDKGSNLKLERKTRSLGGLGLVLLGLTITFASVDWAMSLNPHWFSTIWGVLFMVGQVLSALCLLVMLLARLGEEEPLRAVTRRGTVHDLGKLMLAFTMLWAYLNLSQFLIMWSGNIAEETPFYLARLHGGWKAMAWVLLLFHFIVPFLLLLSRDLKRNARSLALLALALFLLRFLDLYWLIGPDLAGHHGGHGGDHVGLGSAFTYVTAAFGLGGAWLWAFFGALPDRPILPVGDPEIRELLDRPTAAEAH
jgi:hypothetical protein